MTKKHINNSFKIQNLSKIDFSYKLIHVGLSDQLDKNNALKYQALNKALNHVKSKGECPAVRISREGKSYIAVPANNTFEGGKINFKSLVITLDVEERKYTARHNSGRKDDEQIVFKFLDFIIRKHLENDGALFSLGTHNFFLKRPKDTDNKDRRTYVNIHEGFTFRLLRNNEGEYIIVLDTTNKYLENRYLSQFVKEHNRVPLTKQLRGKNCLYNNGESHYTVKIEGFGRAISDEEFSIEKKSHIVYDYALNKLKKSNSYLTRFLKPYHPTLLYTYLGRDEQKFKGATTLAKLILKTDDPKVARLHKKSILPPWEKSKKIKGIIKRYFQNISFNGQQIKVNTTLTKEDLACFPLPALKYKNNFILPVNDYDSYGDFIEERDYPKLRKRTLLRQGILNEKTFDPQILVVPDQWDKVQIKAFRSDIEKQIKRIAPQHPGFQKIVCYDCDRNYLSAIEQVVEIEKKMEEAGATSGYALFILPDSEGKDPKFISNIHDCLKRKFFKTIKFQCASSTKIAEFYKTVYNPNTSTLTEKRLNQNTGWKSYFFYLGLEFLNLNRRWPYALADNLHYDIYVGIDVHGNYIGLSFFFKNGEHIYFDYIETPKRERKKRNEKVFAREVCPQITKKLIKDIKKWNLDPNGIVIVRDGQSFGEETKALKTVIEELDKEGLVNKDSLKWGVVDIHKNSAIPQRLFVQTDAHNGYQNPKSGTYKIYENEKIGFLFNTGFPFQIRGCVSPLQVQFRDGNLNYEKVMQDLFDQSMLAFSAPDRSNSLPIILKIIDTFLGHAGAS